MDDRSFDRLARLLGEATDRRAGLKAALAAVLGGAAATTALDADARRKATDKDRKGPSGPDAERRKKRKRKCKPACGAGFDCVKGTCTCATGVTCGDACCRVGQLCDGGACVAEPEPATCIAAGEPCKNAGRPCCDGTVCASGQGGDGDVACHVPKTGRCERTSECVYGMSCQDGRCAPPPPGALGQPCDTAAQQLCTTPGAVCAAYDGPDAPDGSFCTLSLESACSGDRECTCYKCWYVNPGVTGVRRDERATGRFACCGPEGYACRTDRNCCLGTSCVNGACRGKVCVPDDAEGCNGATPCCNPLATCVAGICRTCSPATCPNGCCQNGLCQTGTAAGACGTGGGECAVCGGGTAVCNDDDYICVQCTQNSHCAAEATNKVCRTSSGTCVQCTDDTHCASEATNKYCVSRVCRQCSEDSHCDALSSGSCNTYTCRSGSCTASATKIANTRCNLTGTNDGYCQSAPIAGTCGASIACNIKASDYADAAAAGAALRTLIQGATNDTKLSAVIGIGAGTYSVGAAGTISVAQIPSSTRVMELTACETGANPVIDGGWSGGSATNGVKILRFDGTQLTIRNVDFAHGNANLASEYWGGAIHVSTGALTLENLTVRDSTAQAGGGIYLNSASGDFKNVTVTGCRATTGYGGGIYADINTSPGLKLQGVTIGGTTSATYNTATLGGYGLYTNTANADGTTLTCSGTNSITNGLTTPTTLYDCGFTSYPAPNDGTNVAWYGCGCATQQG